MSSILLGCLEQNEEHLHYVLSDYVRRERVSGKDVLPCAGFPPFRLRCRSHSLGRQCTYQEPQILHGLGPVPYADSDGDYL